MAPAMSRTKKPPAKKSSREKHREPEKMCIFAVETFYQIIIMMMKKLLMGILLTLICSNLRAQEYSRTYTRTAWPYADMLTPNARFSIEDGFYTLSGVDTIPGVTAEDLYLRAHSWISRTYKNPDKVIVSDQKPNQLVVHGQIGQDPQSTGTLELKFKDGRFRWQISHLTTIGTVETRPRYQGERGQQWFNVDFRPFVENLRKGMNQNEDW